MAKVCERLCLVAAAVAVCCFSIVSAAVYLGRLPEKPAQFKDVEGCYVQQTNSMVKFGETAYPIGDCVRIECSSTYIHYATCGVVGTDDPKCYITEVDPSVPYPKCCPTIKCDTNDLL